ncbi:uncharacterized protein LOC109835123 [Asparagus officinalis]|uniref:uncharacterized protein LOC109835123 n=1 Tax=Asparagus officinalis TaxID=4686 RepID=UPI00098E72FA|nr:uncharacterized protein LOC109835123 [Asparagus officinalis]
MTYPLGFIIMFYVPGFFEEGELPLSPVFTGSDNMDSFMEQMCDALRDGSLGIDLNIDLGQVNSVEPTVPYSGISTSDDTLLKHGERESSVLAADVAIEKPAEDGAFHDVGFEEQGCASAPGFSGPGAGLFADMLAEQATRGTVGPPFESDSFTVPDIGTNPISIPGISSSPQSDGLAGPAVVPDATTVSGTDSLPESGVSPPQPRGMTDLPTGVDIPSMTTPAVISEPVGFQPEGTSVGLGSRSSLYERVRALLADTDPDKDIFRTDLGLFTVFYNGMIEKLLHRGYGFDQFRRSFSRHMLMFREEGYPELADSFTADFTVLESEIRELKELKAGGAFSFVSSQMEHKLTQWHDLRSSIGSELRSHEHSVAQLMATVARKDTGRAELLSSLDSGREEVARLKEALRHAEESVTLIAEDLAGLERSREQTLEKLGSTQERLMKLKNEAAEILSSSEDSVRASLQAELEQSYVDRLSSLEFHQ